MKRFVTYLYEYERGNKSKNVGFIRVNVRGGETTMEIYVRNFLRGNSKGRIFALVFQDGLLGIEIEKIEIKNGQSDIRLTFLTENIRESGLSVKDIVGIGVRMDGGAYLVSCWKDMCEVEIARGEFVVWQEAKVLAETESLMTETTEENSHQEMIQEHKLEMKIEAAEKTHISQSVEYQEENGNVYNSSVTYEKIDLSQIRDLPSPNWHLTTNSFLVHGFWNYGYLVLKKELAEDKEKISLGVPGIFEKPEAVMAVLFGFPSFEETPQELATAAMNQPRQFSDKKTNQESKVGTLGSWFVELQN